MRVLGFLTTVLLVAFGVHAYLWWRLVASTTRSRRWRVAGALTCVALIGLFLLAARTPESWPDWLDRAIDLVGLGWIALMFYLLVGLLVLEPVRVAARLVWWRRGRSRAAEPMPVAVGAGADDPAAAETDHAGRTLQEAPPEPAPARPSTDLARRRFLARTLAVTAGAVAVGTVGYGAIEATRVRVKRLPVTLDALDPRLDGFRIALIADVHLSAVIGAPFLADVVRRINGVDAGLVAIVGDLVDGSVAELGDAARGLADLRSRHGTYFVTGNHEYFSGAQEWVDFLPDVGVRVLRNERIEVASNGGRFDLAGIDDRTAARSGVPGHGADLPAALDGRPADRPVVLMAHQPALWPDAVARGVDLQISGHTHGGQLWPFDYLVGLDAPVVQGLARRGDSQIYVTNGVGTWGPRVRVGAPPEVTVIELRSP